MCSDFVFQWIPDILTYNNNKSFLLLLQMTILQNFSFTMPNKNHFFVSGNLNNIDI